VPHGARSVAGDASNVTERAPRVTLDDILRASRVLDRRVHRTPILGSATLGEAFGGRAYLKAELFQRTGSFKPRGVLNKLASLTPEERSRGVITTSAGNLAAALAYGSALHDVDCLVVMWRGASEHKLAVARAYGARVDAEAGDPGDALERMASLRRADGLTLVHPWDDPLMIAGHGTLGLEIVEDRPDVDVVVVPVGGASLIAGVATAVKEARGDVRVVGVEPDRAAGLRAAIAAGKPVPIQPGSIADGLNAPLVGERCLEISRRRVDELVTVSEREIRDAFRFLYARAKLAVEPAGATAAAALLAGKVPSAAGATTVAVVSGGNVAAQTASAILTADEG
jgi:threonine dehydratase